MKKVVIIALCAVFLVGITATVTVLVIDNQNLRKEITVSEQVNSATDISSIINAPDPDAFENLLFKDGETTLSVSYENYHKIKKGMDYNQVASILGDYGILEAHVNKNFTAKWYVWDNFNKKQYVHFQFQDGKLIKKICDEPEYFFDYDVITLQMFRLAFPGVSDSEFATFKACVEFNQGLLMDYDLQRAANGNDIVYSCVISKGAFSSVEGATSQGMEAIRSALKKSIE